MSLGRSVFRKMRRRTFRMMRKNYRHWYQVDEWNHSISKNAYYDSVPERHLKAYLLLYPKEAVHNIAREYLLRVLHERIRSTK